MRTTLSLDSDVAAQLEQLRARGDRSFKQLVNDALRLGLSRLDAEPAAPAGPITRSVSLGRLLIPSLDDVSAVLEFAEGPAHK